MYTNNWHTDNDKLKSSELKSKALKQLLYDIEGPTIKLILFSDNMIQCLIYWHEVQIL